MPRARGRQKAGSTTVGLDLDCLPTLIGFNIRRAQIALWRDFNRQFADGDVRPGVFSALLLANANPGIAQIDIANQLGIDKASVVTLIDRMEQSGWVERRRSTEDRRRQGIFLTPEGVKACALPALEPGELGARLSSSELHRARYATPLRRDEKPEILLAELARLSGCAGGEG